MARIADRDAVVDLAQARDEAVVDALVDEQPAQRRAALAGRAHRREGDGAQREVEVGRGRRRSRRCCRRARGWRGRSAPRAAARPARPMAVEPVAETTGTRGSSTRISPISRPPISTSDRPSGASPKRAIARSTSACVASAVSGVFSDGFQTTGSPQTKASAAFQDQTATGKLKAEITPQTPSGCQVSIMRWSGRSVAMVSAVELARQPDGEVADVDHLLDLAEALREDLAGLERDEPAEIGLCGAQLLAEQAHELAAPRRRHAAPAQERVVRRGGWRPSPPRARSRGHGSRPRR